MIDGVHGHAANRRLPTHPPISSGFSQGDNFMLQIADLPHSGITILKNKPNFSGRKFHMGILPFIGYQLARSYCASDDLATPPQFKLDIVDQRTSGDIPERKGVAGFNVSPRTSDHLISHLQLVGCKNIALLPIRVMEESNP